MIKQVWDKLSIKTNEPEFIANRMANNPKVRNIQINGNKVTYEQRTWKQDNTEHLDREDG